MYIFKIYFEQALLHGEMILKFLKTELRGGVNV